MTSIYSIISIETRLVTHFNGYKTVTFHEKAMLYVLNHERLVTHFNGYKTVTFHEKAMLYVLNHDFCFFAYWNITKFCRSIHFALVTLIY